MRVMGVVSGAAVWLACCWGCAWLGESEVTRSHQTAIAEQNGTVGLAPGQAAAGPVRPDLGSTEGRLVVAVLPFADESGFRPGVWDLGPEMARLVRTEMAAEDRWAVVREEEAATAGLERKTRDRAAVAEWGRQVQADVVLAGRLTGYELRRFSVGDPLLGGYKAYSAKAELAVDAVWIDSGTATPLQARQELSERGAAVELLGKPRAADQEFERMPELAFGSAEFRASLLGRATTAAVAELLAQLDQAVDRRAAEGSAARGELLSVEGAEVFLSVGREAGAWVGQRYRVEPSWAEDHAATGDPATTGPDEARPEIVVEVVGARLSRGRILDETATVQPGDLVRAIGPSSRRR